MSKIRIRRKGGTPNKQSYSNTGKITLSNDFKKIFAKNDPFPKKKGSFL
jgi:hypothetical protein